MKRPFSPLVWLCAAGTLALGALTLYDPNGVYAEYVNALDRDTPVIAAAFTAAQNGVYPWSSRAEADVSSRSPAYRPLTETVTDAEMRSSVGNDEPFSESALPSPDDPAPVAPAAEDAAAAVPDGVSGEGTDTGADVSTNAPAQVFSGFVTVDQSWFNDALFIGDSHIEGFCDYGGVPNATYYFKRGLDIWSVLSKSFVGGKQTIPQALSQRQFGKIYIMLGINEIGRGTTESYAAQYADVVAQLRELQPDAVIYIQAIFHTSQKKSDTSIYNNDTINARNAAISVLADGQHIFFVDCNAVFDDENGALTSSYSGDGVHVKAPYYTMWRDYLLRFGLPGVAAVDAPAEQDAAPSVPVFSPAPAQSAEAAPKSAEPASTAAEPTVEESDAGQSENGAEERVQSSGGEDASVESVPAAPESDANGSDVVSDADPLDTSAPADFEALEAASDLPEPIASSVAEPAE